MFAAIGSLSFRYRYLFLFIWIAVAIGAVIFAPKVSGVLVAGGFEDKNSESFRSGEINREVLNGGRASLQAVFRHPEWRVEDPRFIEAERRALAEVAKMDGVKSVITYENSRNEKAVSKDRHTTYAVIEFTESADEVKRFLPEVKDNLHPGPLKMWLTGDPAVYADIEQVSQSDLASAERSALPLSLLVLLFIYGTLVAAGMPVIIGFVSVTATLATIYFLGQAIDMSVFVTNMATMLGLAIGIDYSLLMVSRFREELAASGDVELSVKRSVETAGRSIAFSGLAVFIGLSGMLIFPFMNLKSMGIGGQIVVVYSVLAALTLLPAILGILGHRVNSINLRRPVMAVVHRLRPSRPAPQRPVGEVGGFWHTLAINVMRFPVPVIIAVVTLIFVLAAPIFRISVSVPSALDLPKGFDSREGYEILTEEFGENEITPVFLVIDTKGDALSAKNIERVFYYSKDLAEIDGVKRVESYSTLVPAFKSPKEYQALYANPERIAQPEIRKTLEKTTKADITVVRVILKSEDPLSDSSKETVGDIRKLDFPEGKVYAGGFTAGVGDFMTKMYQVFPYAIAIVAALTYIVLLFLFRSVVLPLKAVLMNSLSILASFGVMVAIFQEGRFENIFDFTASGYIDSTLPVVMFSTLFGISMDYEIFLLTRVKEAYDQTKDNTASVALGLERTGGIITSAALIVVIVTGSFVLTQLTFIKALGVGLALAILIDATIIRALLVPATMRLLGKWNWWAPKWMQKVLPGGHLQER